MDIDFYIRMLDLKGDKKKIILIYKTNKMYFVHFCRIKMKCIRYSEIEKHF